MKRYFYTIITCSLLLFTACQQSGSNTDQSKTETTEKAEETPVIQGTWILKKETRGTKSTVVSSKNALECLTFEKNGYYLDFDKITDPTISGSGVGKIQEHNKGQYYIKDKQLTLQHFDGDSLIKEQFEIETMNKNELVLKNKQITRYYSAEKQD